MQRLIVVLIMTVVLLVAPALVSSAAWSTETISKEYGITVSTTDSRWTHRVADVKGYFRMFVDDRENKANVMVTAANRSMDTLKDQPSIEGWMEGRVIPGVLKLYSAPYSYSIDTNETRSVMLGTGEQAISREYVLVINGNPRSLVCLSWEKNGIWYWVRITNHGLYKHLPSSGLAEIAAGIKLAAPAVASK